MKKRRYNYWPEEKVKILKEHLVGHVAVSDLCDKYKLQPTVFYRWQKELFGNGTVAFARENKGKKDSQTKRYKSLRLNCRTEVK